MKWSKFKTRALSGIAATTGALALVAGMIIPASAAPIIPDPNALGSLTVTKLSNPGGTLDPATGLPTTPPTGAELLAGATFQLEPVASIGGVPVDLNTDAGWQAIADATPADLIAGDLGSPVTTDVTPADRTTTAAGTVVWDALPIGLYLVTETQAPGGHVGSNPFFVTVPITNPTTLTDWVYDVYVYPKNSETTVEITLVDEDTVQAGDTIEYTISADIPVLTPESTLTNFVLTDQLDPRLSIDPTATTIAAKIVDPTGIGPDVPLTFGTDFVVTPASTGSVVDGAGLEFDFTPSIAELVANQGWTVELTITPTVNTTINTDLDPIVNQGFLYVNHPASEISADPTDPNNPPNVSTDEVESRFGQLEITKVDAANAATTLTGAEFAVYLTEADALAQTNAIATSTDNTDGTYSFPSLRLSNWENGAELTNDADWRTYWLVETEAPADYNLSTKPFPFYLLNEGTTYTPAGSYIGGVVNVNGVFEYEFPNAKKLTLPLTGGKGAVIFTVGGVALIAFAAVLFARSRRNESSSAN